MECGCRSAPQPGSSVTTTRKKPSLRQCGRSADSLGAAVKHLFHAAKMWMDGICWEFDRMLNS